MRRTPTRNLTEPTRTCVGCRRLRARTELVRFVIDGGALKLGANRPGRGAWVCGESPIECFDAATEARGWSRSFPDEDYDGINRRSSGRTCSPIPVKE